MLQGLVAFEEQAIKGAPLGLTFDYPFLVSVIRGTLNPSYFVDLVLRRRSAV